MITRPAIPSSWKAVRALNEVFDLVCIEWQGDVDILALRLGRRDTHSEELRRWDPIWNEEASRISDRS